MAVRMSEAEYRHAIQGKRNRNAGKYFEEIIAAACLMYKGRGTAYVQKTPEPMTPLRSIGQGRFIACFEKKAQPDYKGTLRGGRSVVFEAKHTDSDRLQQGAVTEWQAEQLEEYEGLGAICFVLVSFGFEKFYKIPWDVFKTMKERYGRKYIKPEDVEIYRIQNKGGFLLFLEEE